MNVVSGLTTTVTIKYNDYNRRLIVNPKSFTASGVNTTTNAITINDHGYETGDKIIHTASTPVGGLDNDGIYYIVKIDSNTFKLTKTDYDAKESKPNVIGILSINTIKESIGIEIESILGGRMSYSTVVSVYAISEY